ncbi:hypothetical protein RFI_19915 [Reticulomyxa filosa]|uniref:Serine carboxypeptidase n=1 Tax=Reticulomyxa filosa TaxID=46433 RepID=X6MUV1_RETFI|nr:hypothetical protein RFI_19915 [Reticulomyxa filosa]|eukprot:ETO17406.1 hypothetical protein RFI_19915 [Reticulomyxa filosa]
MLGDDAMSTVGPSLKMGFNGRQYMDMSAIFGSSSSSANNGWYSTYNNPYVCGGERTMSIYLNKKEVKQAIHVPEDMVWAWRDGRWPRYTKTQTNLIPYYQQWVNKYRILIYFGDVDSSVPYNGGYEWTMGLGYPIIEAFRPWTTNGQTLMGGYVQVYATDNPSLNFTYATVRGAGHMVPQYKPKQSLVMFQMFLQNKTFPTYNGPNS